MIASTLNWDELLQLPAMIDLATAARALGVGRTKAYELAKSGAFPARCFGSGPPTAYAPRTCSGSSASNGSSTAARPMQSRRTRDYASR